MGAVENSILPTGVNSARGFVQDSSGRNNNAERGLSDNNGNDPLYGGRSSGLESIGFPGESESLREEISRIEQAMAHLKSRLQRAQAGGGPGPMSEAYVVPRESGSDLPVSGVPNSAACVERGGDSNDWCPRKD